MRARPVVTFTKDEIGIALYLLAQEDPESYRSPTVRKLLTKIRRAHEVEGRWRIATRNEKASWVKRKLRSLRCSPKKPALNLSKRGHSSASGPRSVTG